VGHGRTTMHRRARCVTLQGVWSDGASLRRCIGARCNAHSCCSRPLCWVPAVHQRTTHGVCPFVCYSLRSQVQVHRPARRRGNTRATGGSEASPAASLLEDAASSTTAAASAAATTTASPTCGDPAGGGCACAGSSEA
jgi:hypothetical protein